MVLKVRVKNEKLRIRPITMPNGFLWLPLLPAVSKMGAMESMQGEKMVTKPAKNEKISSRNMIYPFFAAIYVLMCHFLL